MFQRVQGAHVLYQMVLPDGREVALNGSLSEPLSGIWGTVYLQGEWLRGRQRGVMGCLLVLGAILGSGDSSGHKGPKVQASETTGREPGTPMSANREGGATA